MSIIGDARLYWICESRKSIHLVTPLVFSKLQAVLKANETRMVTKEMPTLLEFIEQQSIDGKCRTDIQTTIGYVSSPHHYDRDVLLARKARIYELHKK